MTYEHTAGNAQFLVGTFVLTKGTQVLQWSLQEYSGEVENFVQPTAVTRNYERLAERNNQTHRVKTDRCGVWGGSQLTAINLPHTCLVSRRLKGGSANYDVSHLTTLKRAQIQHARWPGQLNFVRWRLPFVGPECGTWFMSPTWRLEF